MGRVNRLVSLINVLYVRLAHHSAKNVLKGIRLTVGQKNVSFLQSIIAN